MEACGRELSIALVSRVLIIQTRICRMDCFSTSKKTKIKLIVSLEVSSRREIALPPDKGAESVELKSTAQYIQ